MFIATTDRRLGGGHFRATFIVAMGFTSAVIERTEIVYASRFVPPLQASTPNAMLYFLLGGVLRVEHEGRAAQQFRGPSLLLFEEDLFEGVAGQPRTTFSNLGAPLRVIELRVPRTRIGVVRREPVMELQAPETVWRAAQGLAAQPRSDRAIRARASDLLTALEASGVLLPKVEPAPHLPSRPQARLWSAIVPLAERLALLSPLDTVATLAGLSARQLLRELTRFSSSHVAPFSSWRETTRRLRLKVAVMALSTEDTTVGEAAQLVGYGSLEAMARAFRDAQLPAPRVVRSLLRDERSRLEATSGACGSCPGTGPDFS